MTKVKRMPNKGKKPGFMVYHDKLAQIDKLPDDQFHWFIRAIGRYSETGEIAETDNPALAVLLDIWKAMIDIDTDRYATASEKGQKAAAARWKNVPNNAYASPSISMHDDVSNLMHNDAQDANYQLSTINYQQSSINNQQSTINDKDVCAERREARHSTPKPEPTPSEFNLILNDGTEYNVPLENVDAYKGFYPGVDVEQELRNMAGWCFNNPKNRKTRSGIKRFIGNWLTGEQNKARRPKQNDGKKVTALQYEQRNYSQDDLDSMYTDLSRFEQ